MIFHGSRIGGNPEKNEKTFRTGKHTTISVRSYKKYSKESLLKKLKELNLPDYSNFDCIGAAYNNLTAVLQDIVNEIAPLKDIRVKGNTKPWFESDIIEAIRLRDKLKERFLRTRLHVDHEHFKEQRNLVQQKKKTPLMLRY